MSIPTSVGYDMVIKPWIEAKAHEIGEQMYDCKQCGAWFITSRDHHEENLCVECAGLSRSWDKELHNTRQREYQRKYKRVTKDRRRKEYRNENVCNVT